VNRDLTTADDALSPDFINGSPLWFRVPSDPEDWQAVDKTIAATAAELMSGGDSFGQ